MDISGQFFVRKQAQVILTATMHDASIRCVDLVQVALPTALFYMRRYTLFLSIEVRACCDSRSAVDFTGKQVVFRRRRCGL